MAPRKPNTDETPDVNETPDAPDTPDTEPELTEEEQELARLQAERDQAVAAFDQAVAAKVQRAALVTAREGLDGIDLAAITEAMDEGDTEAATVGLTAAIMTLQAARSALNPGAVTRTVVPAGNGTARRSESSIRDEAISVMRNAPAGTWFSPTQLRDEMAPSPVTGRPRSPGAIGNALQVAARAGDVEMADGPLRFRVA